MTEPKPIEQQWELYRTTVLNPELPDHVLDSLKAVFFAGAAGFWHVQYEVQTAEGMARLFNEVGDEILQYSRDQCDKIGCHCHRRHAN